jgi:NitT/TauT family transport system ATP-binding protein
MTTISSSARAHIELATVSKSFVDARRGHTIALDDVSMAIADGEFVCLLGPSGCGKSTILNLIAGFDRASAGDVLLAGAPVTRPGPDRGMVFQEPMLFPWLNVIDNVTFGPRMAGTSHKDYLKAADRYLQLVGLRGFERHHSWELSGGMRQRVSLARAWISNPKVLLMDEPFAALDAQTRLLMQELLVRIWEETRTTVVFVTHDVEEAIYLADRIIVMTSRPGRIKEEIRVPFARLRHYDDLITAPNFAEIKRRVLHSVREETRKFMAEQERLGA